MEKILKVNHVNDYTRYIHKRGPVDDTRTATKHRYFPDRTGAGTRSPLYGVICQHPLILILVSWSYP